jgi:asparagine synthase (glutamine-hydrolysing)
VLATPSFLLTRGGVDRSLLREAFADVLPASIVQRPGKGAMDGYYYEVLAANAALVRQTLLEGVLASRGLLDRQRIVRDLPKNGEPADGGETDLLILYAAEMWARAQ